ncbi:MAG TPA: response regulator, partial [Aggregatilineales bacterium]|nr:response regulator [Aggregatilineales bacterium]
TLQTLEKVDIVFLDLEMPKLDGYEVLVILKQHFGNNVPIVACTVHTAEINTTRKLGFSSFVAKPLDTDRFPNQLSRILNGDPVWEPR